ncbi:hypothetical protein JSY14_00085 [Brachybacterium sp. EF45031]|uniref:hypothetical protein n=1 Tax=Brachybacterium sillae TaxID=2810536 RepID=UPI00217CE3A5|nr:hypothetical protein [Brachybacterium sillae]MCS6710490.1 hypothetical protein [Brachybacterium sillae]
MPGDTADEDALPGDFVPPDPPMPSLEGPLAWSWGALIIGLLVGLLVLVVPTLPGWLGVLGGFAALAGLVGALWQVPRRRVDPDDDGAQV